MALKIKSYSTDYGLTYTDLYYRVERVSYDNTQKIIRFSGAAYISEETASGGIQPIFLEPIPGVLQFSDCIYDAEDLKNRETAEDKVRFILGRRFEKLRWKSQCRLFNG